jgi:hypothetical protein
LGRLRRHDGKLLWELDGCPGLYVWCTDQEGVKARFQTESGTQSAWFTRSPESEEQIRRTLRLEYLPRDEWRWCDVCCEPARDTLADINAGRLLCYACFEQEAKEHAAPSSRSPEP